MPKPAYLPPAAESAPAAPQDAPADADARVTPDPAPPAPPIAPAAADLTPVRLLVDCQHGKCNAIALLHADELAQAQAAGIADSDKAAVAYAESLVKPR